MEKRLHISKYQLSQKFTSCDTYRKFESVEISAAKSDQYRNKVALSQIIKMVLSGETDLSKVYDLCGSNNRLSEDQLLSDENASEFYATDENLRLKTKQEAYRYTRYLAEELKKRREDLTLKIDLPMLEIEVGNYIVDSIRPEALFIERTMNDEVMLEGVFYANKAAPTYTSKTLDAHLQTASKSKVVDMKHRVLKNWLDPYMALRYLLLICKEDWFLKKIGIKKGDKIHLSGSCYYMKYKSSDDKIDTFFGNTGSTVSVGIGIIAGEDKGTPWDDDFKEYALFHELGVSQDKCSEADCKFCPRQESCRFLKSPRQLTDSVTVSPKKKAAADFTPTQEQMELIHPGNQATLCIARAGSGKTATATRTVDAWLKDGVNPKEILVLSFTKNATKEFKERVVALNRAGEDCNFFTFHGFALDVIKNYFKEFGFTKEPREINEVDNSKIIDMLLSDKKIPGEPALYNRNFNGILNVTAAAIRLYSYIAEHPDDMLDVSVLGNADAYGCTQATINELEVLYQEYLDFLIEDNVMLFSQMEPMMHRIFQMHPEYLKGKKYHHVIVDEFQDSSSIQMQTVKALYEELNSDPSGRLVAIGDDWQSIYGWREGDVTNMTEFESKLGYPVHVAEMLTNWRSTAQILSLADDEISQNENQTGSRTIAGRGDGQFDPVVKGFHSEEQEYAAICNWIMDNVKAGFSFSDQAIISRTNKELVSIASTLSEHGIPYVFRSPVKYSANSRVKAAISFTKNIFSPEEEGVTEGYFSYLAAKYDGEMLNTLTPDEVQSEIAELYETFSSISELPYEAQQAIWWKYLDAIRAEDEVYCSFLDDYVKSYPEIEEQYEFICNFEAYGQNMAMHMKADYNGVVLTTAHSAKGLEWKVVYNTITNFDSVGLQMDSVDRRKEREEIRRLFYVSMTRAKDKLYVTGQYLIPGTKTRSAELGGVVYNKFLEEIIELDGQTYDPIDPEEKKKKEERAAKAAARRNKTKPSSKMSPMSPERKAWYNDLVAGCKQASLV